MPLSGLLAEYSWPSIFYVFGAVGVVWSLAFIWTVHEDPSSSPKIDENEKIYINKSIWGTGNTDKSPKIPWSNVLKSLPFYAILLAHVSFWQLLKFTDDNQKFFVFSFFVYKQMAQNYGYEFLMTELPTYMKQILRFSIKEV
jgi:MFS transporter, ACS family, solute carrier family 17 (sodium-dependent inorganic phosphate cotransporter), member 5